MKNKNVWIINQYASTPETGFGGRHYYLANELARNGYTVYLISARFTHNLQKPHEFDEPFFLEKNELITNVWVNVPEYKKVSSLARVRNWFVFAYKITKLSSHIKALPDVIYYSSLSLIGYLGAYFLSKRHSVPIIFEIRDIWPLTLTEMSNISKYHPLVLFLRCIEFFSYKTADYFLSNLPNAIAHLKKFGVSEQKFSYLPNGICLREMSLIEPINQEMKLSLTKYRKKFIIGYIGTIGVANALDILIESAMLLKNNNDIHFIIVGDGGEKSNLMSAVKKMGLTNVEFFSAVPKKQVQTVIKYFDVCYLGWRDRALYKFGIGANKLPEYLYSGKPVLHSYSGEEDPIIKFSAGISVPAEQPLKVVEAIHQFMSMSEVTIMEIGERGYQSAIKFYSYKVITAKLQKIIESLFRGH